MCEKMKSITLAGVSAKDFTKESSNLFKYHLLQGSLKTVLKKLK